MLIKDFAFCSPPKTPITDFPIYFRAKIKIAKAKTKMKGCEKFANKIFVIV